MRRNEEIIEENQLKLFIYQVTFIWVRTPSLDIEVTNTWNEHRKSIHLLYDFNHHKKF